MYHQNCPNSSWLVKMVSKDCELFWCQCFESEIEESRKTEVGKLKTSEPFRRVSRKDASSRLRLRLGSQGEQQSKLTVTTTKQQPASTVLSLLSRSAYLYHGETITTRIPSPGRDSQVTTTRSEQLGHDQRASAVEI